MRHHVRSNRLRITGGRLKGMRGGALNSMHKLHSPEHHGNISVLKHELSKLSIKPKKRIIF